MKNLTQRKLKGISTWFYDFWLYGQRHRGWLGPVAAMDPGEAKRELEQVRAKVVLDLHETKTGKETFQKVFETYLGYLEKNSPSTHDSVKHIKTLRFFYPYPKNAIDEALITAYMQKRLASKTKAKRPPSGPSINRELEYARAAMNRFAADVLPNPFATWLKKNAFKENERVEYLTTEQIGKLLVACADSQNPHLKTIVEAAIVSGQRKAEILTIHESQVDFGLGEIRLRVKGGKAHSITVPDALMADFQRLFSQSRHGYLFENPRTGRPYGSIRSAWKKAKKTAGISNFRFHDLRHTYATYALLAGVDIRVLKDQLGHARLATTEKYAHVVTELRRQSSQHAAAFIGRFINKGTEDAKRDRTKNRTS